MPRVRWMRASSKTWEPRTEFIGPACCPTVKLCSLPWAHPLPPGASRASRWLRLNANGTADATFDPGTRATANGNGIFVDGQFPLPNGQLLIDGFFSGYSGNPCNGLARLNADGSFDPTCGPLRYVQRSHQPSTPNCKILVASNVLSVKAPQAVADRTLVWPVPAHTSLHLAPDVSAMPQTLDLFDAVGRAVRHLALTGAASVTLPVETLPAGLYMLRVTYAEGTVLRRVQLQ